MGRRTLVLHMLHNVLAEGFNIVEVLLSHTCHLYTEFLIDSGNDFK